MNLAFSSLATHQKIDEFLKTGMVELLCNAKPFGSRHWEYPWAVEQSGILGRSGLRILDVAPDFTFPYASFLEKNHQITFIDLEKRKWSDSVTWGATVCDLATRSDYRIMDVRSMSFEDETFDLIFCISVLEHIVCPTQDPDNPELARIFDPHGARPALREMRRCLKPGGRLILTIDIYDGPSWGNYFQQWDIFADLRETGFKIGHLPLFDREKAFRSPDTFISQFHGPYLTLGFSLDK